MVIGGGGRYDYLATKITGTNIPAVGFYLNLDSIFNLMLQRNMFQMQDKDFKVYLCAQNEDMELMTLQIAQELHNSGIQTVISPEVTSTEAEQKRAEMHDCALMLIIREENIREGKILLRNLVKESQNYIQLKDTMPAVLLAKKALKQ